MEKALTSLTVFFEGPFWVGVLERTSGGRYEACKITFGAEPKEPELYELLLKNWPKLSFSPALRAGEPQQKPKSPKRMQRAIAQQLQNTGVGTKAQQALQLMREEQKAERRQASRAQREEEAQRRYSLRQQKRKDKHRGR